MEGSILGTWNFWVGLDSSDDPEVVAMLLDGMYDHGWFEFLFPAGPIDFASEEV